MKTPSKKTVIIIVVAIVLIFALRAAKSKWENSGGDETEKDSNPVSATSSTSTATKSTNLPNCGVGKILKSGDKCKAVFFAQIQINYVHSKLGISKLQEDGVFGGNTKAAFKKLLGKEAGKYQEVVTAVSALKNS